MLLSSRNWCYDDPIHLKQNNKNKQIKCLSTNSLFGRKALQCVGKWTYLSPSRTM